MERLETLSRRLDTANQLESIVETMKTLASINIRQYEKSVDSLSRYQRTIRLGLRVLLDERPPGVQISEPETDAPGGIVVIGSDQGMCGGFNDAVVDFALRQIRTDGPRTPPRLMAVGERAVTRLENADVSVHETTRLPGSVEGITEGVQDTLLVIDAWRERMGVERVRIVSNHPEEPASYRPRSIQLLPVDPDWLRELEASQWPTRILPEFTLDWRPLFSALIEQHLFVTVYRCLAESLAGENASRLQAMGSAHENIKKRREEIIREYHRVRQQGITEEILDLTSGFEALSTESG